jgi:hypothetical protein
MKNMLSRSLPGKNTRSRLTGSTEPTCIISASESQAIAQAPHSPITYQPANLPTCQPANLPTYERAPA